MSYSATDDSSAEDDSGYLLVVCLSNTRKVTQLLKAIHFREVTYGYLQIFQKLMSISMVQGNIYLLSNACSQNAMVFASATGLKVVVEEAKWIQASAYLQADMFNHFTINEESLTFKINLTVLLVSRRYS